MDLSEAWRLYGKDISAIVAEAKSRKRPERLAYVEEMLEDAKEIRKRLQARHHPDRNPGDPTAADRFRRVTEAYDVIEKGTEEFRRQFTEAEARREADRDGKRAVFIDVIPLK